MEIIQLVAVNVHDKAQHIVGQSRKPCTFIPQQVEYFRCFVLGSGADIDCRAVTAIHRREERAFEIRQRDLFTPESGRLLSSSRLGVDVCFLSSRCRCSGYRFRCVFLGSARNGCNIAPGTDPPSEAVAEVWQSFFENFSAADSYPRQRVASCTFVRQTAFCPTKVLALRGWAFSRVATLF